ncbi:MAG: SMP-30/gluconolactonase/LRE family protein [Spirochaetia bacterium]
MIYEHFLPAGKGLFHPDYPFTQVAANFRFLEGPAWHPHEHHLTFSDIMGNALYRWFPQSGVELLRPNSYLSNGNTYDRNGLLITCEHGTSAVSRTESDGSRTVLASQYKGKNLNSPNDVVVRTDGTIYFTDPTPGRLGRVGIPRDLDLDFTGVFALNPTTGKLQLLADDFLLPNGICLSLDERELFVNDSKHQHIRRFAFNADGNVSGGEVWAELITDGPGVADGLKFSREGLLFCSAPRGIQIFNSEGDLAGRLYTPEIAANFTWGGPDMKTMYLTAHTSLYSIRTAAEGVPLF